MFTGNTNPECSSSVKSSLKAPVNPATYYQMAQAYQHTLENMNRMHAQFQNVPQNKVAETGE